MRTILIILLGSWCLAAPAAPAGITLQPGTYQLQWQIPELDKKFGSEYPIQSRVDTRYNCDLSPIGDEERQDIPGTEIRERVRRLRQRIPGVC